jgi:hypothetical protein
VQWRTFVNTVTNLRVPKSGEFLNQSIDCQHLKKDFCSMDIAVARIDGLTQCSSFHAGCTLPPECRSVTSKICSLLNEATFLNYRQKKSLS